MKKGLLFLSVFVMGFSSFAQYQFSGQVDQEYEGGKVYLSMIEDYRKISGVYNEQILKQSLPDSTGFFQFNGDNLPLENRIYRIHVDLCSEENQNLNHFSGHCPLSKEIIFIANNTSTLSFPFGFSNEMFCKVIAEEDRARAFLKIDSLKHDMEFAFASYRSEANKKLNEKKWFTTLQNYGEALNEPLAELYIYSFLSDRSNDLYAHYLEDLKTSPYYDNLLQRLENKYPKTTYVTQYETELKADRYLIDDSENTAWLFYLLGGICIVSLLANLFFFRKWKLLKNKQTDTATLSNQEEKVMHLILQEKSNKEIADELFVSVSTIKTHINNLYRKLNISSREELKHFKIK